MIARREAPPDALAVGVLGRPHGVRGELSLRLYNPQSDLFDQITLPMNVWVRGADGSDRPVDLLRVRPGGAEGDRWLIEVAGVTDRDEAARLTNHQFLMDRGLLGPLPDDEFYLEDLIGCTVYDQDGQARGQAAGVFWNGAHHVLAVMDGRRETLLPVVPQFILDMNPAGKRLQMQFLEEDEGEAPAPPNPSDLSARRSPRRSGRRG